MHVSSRSCDFCMKSIALETTDGVMDGIGVEHDGLALRLSDHPVLAKCKHHICKQCAMNILGIIQHGVFGEFLIGEASLPE